MPQPKEIIIVGKEGNQPFPITDPHVSRKHATLTVYADGKMHLEDNHSTNGTFVRMKDGTFKAIKEIDVNPGVILRLGPSLECKVKDLIKEEEVDITPLKYLEENYNREKVAIKQRSSTLATLKLMVMVTGSAITGILGLVVKDGDMKIVLAAIPLLVAALGYFILIRMNNKTIHRDNICEMNYKKHYVCPKCHFSFQGKVYNNIRAAGNCPNPNCKVKFKGEF